MSTTTARHTSHPLSRLVRPNLSSQLLVRFECMLQDLYDAFRLSCNVCSSMDAVAVFLALSLEVPPQLLVVPRQSLQALSDVQSEQLTSSAIVFISAIVCIFPPGGLLGTGGRRQFDGAW